MMKYLKLFLIYGSLAFFSGCEKKELEKDLNAKKISLTREIADIENKNLLLSEELNFDYVDTLIRKKLKFGNKDEILIRLNE